MRGDRRDVGRRDTKTHANGGTLPDEQEVGALRQLAVDGKVLRGHGRQDGKPLQWLSAVTQHLRLTLDQIPLAEKRNESPASHRC